jgi:hypothetical protein
LKTTFSKASRLFTVESPPDWGKYRRTPVGDQIAITNLIDISKLKKTPSGEYYGKHPIHGSTTGMNFFVNPSKNMWHCFRHNSGGDSMAWLAIMEGQCDCADFSVGGKKLKGKDFINTLKVAKDRYNVKVEQIIIDKMSTDLKAYEVTQEMIDSISLGDLEIVRSDEVNGLDIKPVEWLVDGFILADRTLNIYAGRSGSYKSLTALHIAHCIAEGKPVFGRYATKQSEVLYINEENTWSVFKPMVQKIMRGVDCAGGSKHLHFCTYQNLSLDTNNAEARARLEKVIMEKGIKVLFIDALKRVINFDENDANRVNEFYNHVIKPLIAKYDLTVILLHHTKKENTNMKFRIDKKDLIRGSSDFVNIADSILYFEKGVKNLFFNLFQIKNRLAEEFQTKGIKIIVNEIKGEQAFHFEELTTQAEDVEQLMTNQCAIDILNFCVKRNIETFKTSYIKDVLASRYKKTAVHSAITDMVQANIVIAQATRGTYKLNMSSPEVIDAQQKRMEEPNDENEQTQTETENNSGQQNGSGSQTDSD